MPYPYPYTYFNPTGKEQAALGIGSLLAGLLGAASGRNGGDAAVRGLAGLTGGYGAGYQNYQNMMGDAFQRDLYDKKYNQDVREYEETDKPLKRAQIEHYKNYQQTETGLGHFPLFRKLDPEAAARIDAGKGTAHDIWKYKKLERDYAYSQMKAVDPEGNPLYAPSKFTDLGDEPEDPFNLSNKLPQQQEGPLKAKPKYANAQPITKPELPASNIEAIGNLDSLQKDINALRTMFENSKGRYTGAEALPSKIGQIFPESLGGTSKPNREFRAVYNRLFKNMFSEGGKNLTSTEQKILKPIFPNINSIDEQFPVDLDNLEQTYNNLKQSRLKTFGDVGFRNIENVKQGLTPSNKQEVISAPKTAEEYLSKFK